MVMCAGVASHGSSAQLGVEPVAESGCDPSVKAGCGFAVEVEGPLGGYILGGDAFG